MTRHSNRLSEAWATWFVILIFAAFSFPYSESWIEFWQFDRSAIESGEVWRLLTCHFIHYSGWHWLLNISGLLVLGLLLWRHRLPLGIGWLMALAVTLIGAELWWFSSLTHYAGLSGALTALFIMSALDGLRYSPERGVAIVILLLFTLKLAQAYVPLLGLFDNSALIGAQTYHPAHEMGALAALLVFTTARLRARFAAQR